MSEKQWTRLNPRWLLKQFAVAALFTGFGLWGLYDALAVYPARGLAYAQYTKYQYLEQAKRKAAGASSWGDLSVPDPKGEYERLHKDIEGEKDPVVRAKHDWLDSLAIVGRLSPADTKVENAPTEHDALDKKFNATSGTVNIPKKLEWYDIPSQWAIFGVGMLIGGTMFGFAAVVSRTRFGWDPAAQELTLPGGHTLTVPQCEDFDRRKWDKFLMFIKVKPDHPTLAGQELKLDLLRYVPLESWIVEMEYTAFPDRKVETDDADVLPQPDEGTPDAPGV